jgi:hypothetical protein
LDDDSSCSFLWWFWFRKWELLLMVLKMNWSWW